MQEKLREAMTKYTKNRTETYISEQTGIPRSTLNQFKHGKFDLYPHLEEKLRKFFEDRGGL